MDLQHQKLYYEYCPACGRTLPRRNAILHYRAHVRRGELVGGCLTGQLHTRFRLPTQNDWFQHGKPVVRDG